MASSPGGLWIGCPLSLLLLIVASCLIENATTAPSEPGNQANCMTDIIVQCNSDTGHWCAAVVTLFLSNIDHRTPEFYPNGCGFVPSNKTIFRSPVSDKLKCFKGDLLKGGIQQYECYCDSASCNVNNNKTTALFFAEARHQYHAENDPTTTTTTTTLATTTEARRETRSELDNTDTTTKKSKKRSGSMNGTLTTAVVICAIFFLICAVAVFGKAGHYLWELKKERKARKPYGDKGLVMIDAPAVLIAWLQYDLKIQGEYGLSEETNATNLIKGEEFEKTFFFKPSQRKAIAPGTNVQVKVSDQKMIHANYVDERIICTFDPDASTIGVWIKMAVALTPALIVTIDNQQEPADNFKCCLLGENPAAPKQSAVPVKQKEEKTSFWNRFGNRKGNRFEKKCTEGILISRRQIRLTDDAKSHECEHLMYTGWPEGDIPDDNNDISLLAAYVYENYTCQNKLIIITSNRGCGRAGTFAFTQTLLKAASTRLCSSNDDVIEIAKKIRKSRFAAIAGPKQFGFGIAVALAVHGERLNNENLRKKSLLLEGAFNTELEKLSDLVSKAEADEPTLPPTQAVLINTGPVKSNLAKPHQLKKDRETFDPNKKLSFRVPADHATGEPKRCPDRSSQRPKKKSKRSKRSRKEEIVNEEKKEESEGDKEEEKEEEKEKKKKKKTKKSKNKKDKKKKSKKPKKSKQKKSKKSKSSEDSTSSESEKETKNDTATMNDTVTMNNDQTVMFV